MTVRALVFVYGTLRPGEGNYWIEPAVLDVVEDCTTQGEMYWVRRTWGFPVVDFDAEGIVTGTLLSMNISHEDFRDMMYMELGAGYEPRDVKVTKPDGSTVMATAFHWPDHRDRGERIESGDWKIETHQGVKRR